MSDPWQTFVAGEPVRRREILQHRAVTTLAAVRVPATLAVVVILLGAPVGLLWARVSPRVSVSFSAQGPSLVRPESSEFFAADGSFGVVLLLVGLLTGAAAWRLLRDRVDDVGVPIGLTVGALAAAAVAQAVGGRRVVDRQLAALCEIEAACPIYDGTLQLRSRGLVVVWAVGALAVYVGLRLLFDQHPDDVEPVDLDPAWAPPLVE